MKLFSNLFEKIKLLWYNVSNTKREEKIIMYSALDVARYVVNYANKNDMIVSNLKLQKILYFIQMQFLINNPNRPCFDDDIEAWAFGPVVPKVYREFKRYGSLSIPPIEYYYDTSNGIWNLEKKRYHTTLQPEDRAVVDEVINMCDEYSASDLVSITHKQTPWINARNKRNQTITVDSILNFIDKYIKNRDD